MGSKLSCIPGRLNSCKRIRTEKKSSRIRRELPAEPVTFSRVPSKPGFDQIRANHSVQAQTSLIKVNPIQETSSSKGESLFDDLLSNPLVEWHRSGMSREALGQMIHCSQVKIHHQHCQDLNDRYLVLFQNHLLILSKESQIFMHQGTLPLAGITAQMGSESDSDDDYTFQITGPLLHPIIVHCSGQDEIRRWLGYLEKPTSRDRKSGGSTRARTSGELCMAPGQGLAPPLPRRNKPTRDVFTFPEVTLENASGGARSSWAATRGGDRTGQPLSPDYVDPYTPPKAWLSVSTGSGGTNESAAKHRSSPFPDRDADSRLSGRKALAFSQPPVPPGRASPDRRSLLDDNAAYSNPLSPGYAEPFALFGNRPAAFAGAEGSRRQSLVRRASSVKKRGSKGSGYGGGDVCAAARASPHVETDLRGDLLSPTYAEPYIALRLQPAPPANPLRLDKSAVKHRSSPCPESDAGTGISTRKTLALSQPPTKSFSSPLSPVYAEPFAQAHYQLVPPADRLSYQHFDSNRASRASSFAGENPWPQPLSPTYAEPYVSLSFHPELPGNVSWLRQQQEVSLKGCSDLPNHCSRDDIAEYDRILDVLDTYRPGKTDSFYSDHSRHSYTSSEHDYVGVQYLMGGWSESIGNSDVKQPVVPHLSPASLSRLCQRGAWDSRLQGKVNRWS